MIQDRNKNYLVLANDTQHPQETSSSSNDSIEQRLPPRRDYASQGFKFKELSKSMKKIQKTQSKIYRELCRDEVDWLEKASYAIWNGAKRIAGARVKTLEDLFREQEGQVNVLCNALSDLYYTADNHYYKISSFSDRGYRKLQNMATTRSLIEREIGDEQKEYFELHRRLRGLSRSNPQYYEIERRLERLKESSDHRGNIIITHSTHKFSVESMVKKVDILAKVLLHGRDSTGKILLDYKLVQEYVNEIAPSMLFSRNLSRTETLLGNVDSPLTSLHRQMWEIINQTSNIEERLSNPFLLWDAYGAFPFLPCNEGMTGLLDCINSEFKSGRMRGLL